MRRRMGWKPEVLPAVFIAILAFVPMAFSQGAVEGAKAGTNPDWLRMPAAEFSGASVRPPAVLFVLAVLVESAPSVMAADAAEHRIPSRLDGNCRFADRAIVDFKVVL